ncbi:MAG: thiamine pyrophosphate-binding protein [Pseudomonadota bacterium]
MSERNRGADAVMRQLAARGVDTVFTLSGNHIMSLFDAALETNITLVHTRHEGAAVHMADAYGRLTGKPGVAMVTGGPGHANACGALFTALGADSPMVLLSGHAPTSQAGWAAFQELDQAAMAAPVTKASWTAAAGADLAGEVDRALDLAVAGRPGPVHLSLPSDLLDGEASTPATASATTRTPTDAPTYNDAEGWAVAQRWIAEAAKPLIVAGPVFARAEIGDSMRQAASLMGIPVVVQESPRGLNDPSLGAFADVLAEADLIILANKACDFTVRFAQPPFVREDAKVIALSADTDQLELARARKGANAVLIASDAAATVAGLTRLEGQARAVDAAWRTRVADAIAYRPDEWSGPQESKPSMLHPLEMCAAIKPILDAAPNAVLIMDGGEIGQWAQATLSARRRITNSVTGSIGASLPFAIGARYVEGDAPVITIMGDGTVGFHLAEFETAVREKTPFICIVGNDANWNAEYQIQVNDYGAARAKGCELLPSAYDEVCAALGGYGARVTTPAELTEALDAAVASGKPACINVMLDGRGAPKIRLP